MTPRRRPALDRVYIGDALAVLQRWWGGFVDLVVTSPPYFQLRDYGVAGQLGLEATATEYLQNLLAVLREAGRMLNDTGSLFVNLGDTYHNKTLLGIPWRVALALVDDGWRLRNAIIWHKPNGLPSSVTDRLTGRYEFVFHFTKSSHYFYDLDPIRVPHTTAGEGEVRRPPRDPLYHPSWTRSVSGHFRPHPAGKNPGDVWTIRPETRAKRHLDPDGVGHFAPYPEELCARIIQAACPQGGIVLDPFLGSGTTAVVARRLGRRYLGIELSPDYAQAAERRVAATAVDQPQATRSRIERPRSRPSHPSRPGRRP